jgi:hypothetical protein
MILPIDIITYIKSIPRLADHPRKHDPMPGDLAWCGQRFDCNGLMVWNGARWVFAVTEDA